MIIPIHNKIGNYQECCILEFQGEIAGELNGKELGKLEIKEVRKYPFFQWRLSCYLFLSGWTC
jgi:hypothetical protein